MKRFMRLGSNHPISNFTHFWYGVSSPRKKNKPDSEELVYFKECLSDISHAYFLNLGSLYKSARSSLRSGIENAVRVALINKGVNVKKIASVFELFNEAKSIYKNDVFVHSFLIKLNAIYADLCRSVHSSDANYLSLSVPFERLSKFDETQFIAENDRLRDVCSVINQCAFWMWHDKLSSAGHANEDMVLDAVPRTVKRAKTA
ncbi:hypothetical protein [Sphingobium ummariense]